MSHPNTSLIRLFGFLFVGVIAFLLISLVIACVPSNSHPVLSASSPTSPQPSLNENTSITNPASGLGGTSTLIASDFVSATPSPISQSTGGITDPGAVFTPGPLPLPAYNTTITDPVFGTSIRRITKATNSGSFGTHIYSQLQAFSPNNTYILLYENDDTTVRRVSDLTLMSLDTSEWNAPRWQPALPNSIIHYDSNADTTLRVQYTDVETGQTTTVFTFPSQYEHIRGNQSFDELSHDGRWMGGMAARSDGAEVIFALDLSNLTLGAQLAVPDLYAGTCTPDPEWGEVEPDWVGVSPLGNYLVVQWAADGTDRCNGLETFDLASGVFVGRVYDGHQHGDLGVDSDGATEIFMTFEMSAPPPDNDFPALGVRTLPGNDTVVDPTYVQVIGWFGDHISCQGPHGVCLITTYDNGGDWSALEDELFLQYTDGSVLRLAHHRSSDCGYWVQPRASISRDGRYVVFASDWSQGTGTDSCGGGNDLGAGEAYLINLGSETSPGDGFSLNLPLIGK